MRFGAHTVSHTVLSRLAPPAAAAEIGESRGRIEAELGRAVELFAYPNGGRDDFDEAAKHSLRAAGIRAAVTTIWGANDRDSDPLALHRVSLIDADPGLSGLRLAVGRARVR